MWSLFLKWFKVLACLFGAPIRQNASFTQEFHSLVHRNWWSVLKSHHQHQNKLPKSTTYRKYSPHQPSHFIFSLHKMLKCCVPDMQLSHTVSVPQTFLLSWIFKELSVFHLSCLPGRKSLLLKISAEKGCWKQNSQAVLGYDFLPVCVILYLKRYQ